MANMGPSVPLNVIQNFIRFLWIRASNGPPTRGQMESYILRLSDLNPMGLPEWPLCVCQFIVNSNNDALGRQVTEAIFIREADEKCLINNKKEYNQPGDVVAQYSKGAMRKDMMENYDEKLYTKEVIKKIWQKFRKDEIGQRRKS